MPGRSSWVPGPHTELGLLVGRRRARSVNRRPSGRWRSPASSRSWASASSTRSCRRWPSSSRATPAQVSLLFTSYLLITAVAMLVTGWVSSRHRGEGHAGHGSDDHRRVRGARRGCPARSARSSASGPAGASGNALFIATSLAVIVACASGGFAGAIILYETALGVGIALGPLVGGLLGSVSWRAPFFGVAVLMAIALVATLVLLDKTPKPAEKIGLLDPIKALRHRSLATIAVDGLRLQLGLLHPARVLALLHGRPRPDSAWAGCSPPGACSSRSSRCSCAPALERRFGTVRVLYFVLGLLAVDLAGDRDLARPPRPS